MISLPSYAQYWPSFSLFWGAYILFSAVAVRVKSVMSIIWCVLHTHRILEVFPTLLLFGRVWEGLVVVLGMFGRICQWSHLVLDLFVGSFLISDWIFLLVIDLFRFSVSSWFRPGRFCTARNVPIYSGLSRLWAWWSFMILYICVVMVVMFSF